MPSLFRIFSYTVLAFALMSQVACSKPIANNKDESAVLLKKLAPYFKGKITAIRPSEVAGLYEVTIDDRTVFFADASGKYLIDGDIIEIKTQRALSEARKTELNKARMSSLPLQYAITEVRGTGARKMVVFSDPDCPFCHRLEHNIAQMDNVTIYTLLFPLPSLHPDASRKANLIYCAANPLAAWRNWIDKQTLPEAKGNCQAPLAEIAKVAADWGVNGTPHIVLIDGQSFSGAASAEELEKAFATPQ